MLGTLDHRYKEATIVGGGAAGLIAAYHLVQSGCKVTLFEKSPRLGGLIATTQHPLGLIERAANSLLSNSQLLHMCETIGVPLQPSSPDAKSKYILKNNRLKKFPLGIGATLDLVRRIATQSATKESPTVAEWAKTHLGDSALEYLIQPMVTGIYGARAEELLLDICFPALGVPVGKTLLQKFIGRQFSGKKSTKRVILSPEGGMETLITKLDQFLRSSRCCRIETNMEITNLPDSPNLIVSAPAHAAAILLNKSSPESAKALAQVRYVPLISAGVFISRKNLRLNPRGLGVLIPPVEGKNILGVLFSSSCFPSRVTHSDDVLFTLMLGGSQNEGLLDLNYQQLCEVISSEIDSIFGLNGNPKDIVVHRWPKAIPMYNKNLVSIWSQVRKDFCQKPGRILFGNYSGAVSLRGMIETSAKEFGGVF